ncbi:MAG: response regulator, partial [Xanthomonadales bacterium]|nr:response regulator [Xanthomonadales bacterium]
DAAARVREVVEPAGEQPYRVMIIEDDRSQALFAESVLRKAGMETCAVMDALQSLEQLDEFKPDLILMDLYMPGISGM